MMTTTRRRRRTRRTWTSVSVLLGVLAVVVGVFGVRVEGARVVKVAEGAERTATTVIEHEQWWHWRWVVGGAHEGDADEDAHEDAHGWLIGVRKTLADAQQWSDECTRAMAMVHASGAINTTLRSPGIAASCALRPAIVPLLDRAAAAAATTSADRATFYASLTRHALRLIDPHAFACSREDDSATTGATATSAAIVLEQALFRDTPWSLKDVTSASSSPSSSLPALRLLFSALARARAFVAPTPPPTPQQPSRFDSVLYVARLARPSSSSTSTSRSPVTAPCAVSTSAPNTPPLRITALTRSWSSEGFHRTIEHAVVLALDRAHVHDDRERPDELLLVQWLPSSFYVNLYEMAERHRLGSSQRVLSTVDHDVEQPMHAAPSNLVVLRVPLDAHAAASSATDSLSLRVSLPLHVRYHAPSNSSYVEALVPSPAVFYRASSSKPDAWQHVIVGGDDARAPLVARIPVGHVDDAWWVVLVTTLMCVGGTLYVVLQVARLPATSSATASGVQPRR